MVADAGYAVKRGAVLLLFCFALCKTAPDNTRRGLPQHYAAACLRFLFSPSTTATIITMVTT